MKHIKFYHLILRAGMLTCFVLLTTCNFIEETLPWTKVSGKVIDISTNKPIENVTIIINENTPYSSYASNVKTIATLISDKNGNFSYKFHAKTDESSNDDWKENYILYYYISNSDIPCRDSTKGKGYKLKKGKKNNIILWFSDHGKYYGYFTVHIYNQFPSDINDLICVCDYVPSFNQTCSSINGICRQGININEDAFLNRQSFYGNHYQKIHWWVTKNGITTSYIDSVFINPCDTVTFNINY